MMGLPAAIGHTAGGDLRLPLVIGAGAHEYILGAGAEFTRSTIRSKVSRRSAGYTRAGRRN